MKILYYIRRFWNTPGKERIILTNGVLLAFLIRITILVLPIKYYINLLNFKPKQDLLFDLNSSIKKSKRIFRRINMLLPFTGNCLIKAIILRYILSEHGINSKCVFSLKRMSNKKLNAHAYLMVDTCLIMFKDPEYTDVFAF
jgi:hypothetical protein